MTELPTTKCCGVEPYEDSIEPGRWHCDICDAQVDPTDGHVMTEREQDAWAQLMDTADELHEENR